MPWISDTTAMMEVTATMLPSTIMNDRSLFAQMADSAMPIESRIWFIASRARNWRLTLGAVVRFRRLDLDEIAGLEIADRVEGAGDHLVAGLQARHHLEVLVAGDACL